MPVRTQYYTSYIFYIYSGFCGSFRWVKTYWLPCILFPPHPFRVLFAGPGLGCLVVTSKNRDGRLENALISILFLQQNPNKHGHQCLPSIQNGAGSGHFRGNITYKRSLEQNMRIALTNDVRPAYAFTLVTRNTSAELEQASHYVWKIWVKVIYRLNCNITVALITRSNVFSGPCGVPRCQIQCLTTGRAL